MDLAYTKKEGNPINGKQSTPYTSPIPAKITEPGLSSVSKASLIPAPDPRALHAEERSSPATG